MEATLLWSRTFLVTQLILCLQAPLVHSKLRSVTCTYGSGQECTGTLKRHQRTGRDGWSITKHLLGGLEEHFAQVACSQGCEATLPVWRNLHGSRRPLYLSFYYNIWTMPGGAASMPPVLKIFACRDNPNLIRNITAAGMNSPRWQGAVIPLVCLENFDVSLVATLSSSHQRIAVDNIALTYGFSTRDLLPAPDFDVLALPGTAIPPGTGPTKTAPKGKVLTEPPDATTGLAWGDGTTEHPYTTGAEDEVAYRTLAMVDIRPATKLEDHVAFKPVVAMLFILVVCVTTITVHILICRNQRQISNRLRRTPVTVITPASTKQKEQTPDTFTSSYSSNHGTEPRSVSFCSQKGGPFPGEEGAMESSFPELAQRRQSIACVERKTKPSWLRPNGRANTTPTKPNDEYYESIDGSSRSVGKSGPITLLRKISLNRFPRFLENRRSLSSPGMRKKSSKDESKSSKSPSLLSVTSDSNIRHGRGTVKSGTLTPPLPPRTYPVVGGKDNRKSTSKVTVNETMPRSIVSQSTDNDRRWSDVVCAATLAPSQIEGHSSSNHLNSSLQSLDTVVENTRTDGDVMSDNLGHGYYVLEESDEKREERSSEERSCKVRLSKFEDDRISSDSGCRNNHVCENDTCTVGTVEETSDSECWEKRGRGSTCSSSGFHGYQVLEKQDSLCSSNISHPDDRGYDGDVSSMTESNAYQSLGGSFSSQHTYQSLDQQATRMSGSSDHADSLIGGGPEISRHSKDGKSEDGNLYVQLSPESESGDGRLSVSSSFEQCDYRKLVQAGEEILGEENESTGGYDHISR